MLRGSGVRGSKRVKGFAGISAGASGLCDGKIAPERNQERRFAGPGRGGEVLSARHTVEGSRIR